MQSSDIITPLAIGSPFAVNGDKNIPSQSASGTDTSSIDAGFLPITSEPLDDGGVAPERIDFNGMFYLSTDQRVFLQNGGVITYNANVATKIGGYPKGAILAYIDSNGNHSLVRSLIENNSYNFVTTPSYINGTYWAYSYDNNSVINILKQVYPVGAIYIGTTSTCPLASLFGTWSKVSGNKVLQTSSSSHEANTTIAAGLPNIKGTFKSIDRQAYDTSRQLSGAFSFKSKSSSQNIGDGGTWSDMDVIEFEAADSNTIYGNSSTVQPPAYVVNVWRRTA